MLSHRNWSVSRTVIALSFVFIGVLVVPAFAVNLNWDPTLSGSPFYGGSGAWDVSTTANWYNGATDIQWTDTTGATDTAIFAGDQGGTVTIASNPLGALGVQFGTPGYTLAGTALTLGTGGIAATSIPPGTTTISAPIAVTGTQSWTIGGGSTLVVSNSITGTTRVTKASTGTLVLSGNNSGLIGGITLANGGKLSVASANALGTTGSINFTANAATIENSSGGALTNAGNNPINLNSSSTFVGGAGFNLGTGTVTFGDNRTPVIRGNVTFGPLAGGTFSFSKSGDGLLTIDNATNAYGATAVLGGTLNLGTTGVMGGATQTLTLGNGELSIAGGNTGPRAQATAAYTRNTGRDTITLIAHPAQNNMLTMDSIIASATPAYTTSLYRGNNLGANSIASATAGTANIAFTTAPTPSTIVGSATVFGATGTGTLGTTEAAVLRGALYDASPTGNGTAFATYDPTNGVRALNSATEQTTTYPVATSNDNVRLNLVGATAITGVQTNTLQIENTSGSAQIVTNTGTGLTAENGLLFSGTSPITLTGGTYNYNNIGATAPTDGQILSTNTAGVTIESALGVVTGSNERGWTFGGPGDITVNGALGGAGGNGAVGINGPGTVTLNSATTTSSKGILVQGGTVKLGSNFSMSTSRPWQVAAGATLDMNGKSVANVEALTETNIAGNAAGGVITNSNATTTSLTFTKGSNQGTNRTSAATMTGNMNVVFNHQAPATGTAGNTTLVGQSTYTGTTTMSSGLLTNGITNALPTGTALTVDGGGAVPVVYNLNGFNQQVGSLAGSATATAGNVQNNAATASVLTINGTGNTTFSGVLGGGAGTLNLVKAGSGAQTMAGANTYTGTTLVSSGSLLVNGTHTGGGAYTVNSGGTLGGTGSITTTNSNVVVTTGGSLSPGASAGTLTFDLGTGVLNLAGVNSGGFKFELNTPATSDKVVVSNASTMLNLGTLDFSDFLLTNLGGVTANTDYVLFDAASAFTASLGTASGTFGGFNATLQLDNTTNFDVILKVGAATANLGDFNNDGKVDAADYVVWRKTIGTQLKYDEWRANFGKTYFGSSTGGEGVVSGSGTVPEPATSALLVVLSALVATGWRRRG